MVLERLQLRNFRRHKLQRIRFSPRVTTIVGKSQAGKSTLICGLRWLATNRPNDKTVIRHGTKETSVSLWIDGRRITRSRSNTGQAYSLDGKEFKAFNKDVPPEIVKLLNITDVNLQAQFDAPYWFGLSAPQVSKHLNQIVNINIIDDVLTRLSAANRKAHTQVEIADEQLKAARTSLEETADVPAMHRELCEIERLETEAATTHEKAVALASILSDLESVEWDRKNAAGALLDAENAASAYSAYRKAANNALRLKKLLAEIAQTTETIEDTETAIAEHERIKSKVKVCPLCQNKMT